MDESQHVFVSQVSTQPLFVPGVWGPYLSAMLPELWLNEGGQSATGRLVRAERFRTNIIMKHTIRLRMSCMCSDLTCVFRWSMW